MYSIFLYFIETHKFKIIPIIYWIRIVINKDFNEKHFLINFIGAYIKIKKITKIPINGSILLYIMEFNSNQANIYKNI